MHAWLRLAGDHAALPSRHLLAVLVLFAPALAFAAVPAAPSDVAVNFVTRNEISMFWTAPFGALRYKADYRRAGSGGYESFGPGAIFTLPSLVVGMLPVNVAYEFKIYAGNDEGWSGAALLSPGIAPVDPPQVPIMVRQISFNETSATIAWSMPSSSPPATLFKVSIRQCRTRDSTDVCDPFMFYRTPGATADLETKEQQLKLIGLQKEYIYDVAVLARNFNIKGYSDAQIDVLRIQPRGALQGATITLQVRGVTSSQVSLHWTALPGAKWYRVEYRPTAIGSGSWLYSAMSITQGTAAAVENLDAGVQYQFRIVSASDFRDVKGMLVFSGVGKAGDSEGDQKTSNIETAVPVMPLSGIPAGLRVTAVRAYEISLAWNAHPGATYFQLEYQLASSAYTPMGKWHTYGAPPAHIRDTSVTMPIDRTTSGQVYNLRLNAFNTHVPSGDYPGFVGPDLFCIYKIYYITYINKYMMYV
jgi:hypothetical protein